MSVKTMHDLKEMLCTELDQYTRKGGISRTDLEPIESITTSIKNLCKITEMEENGYSYGSGMWRANGSYSNGMPDVNYSGRRGSRDAYDREMSGRRYSGDDMDDTSYMQGRMHREMNY